MSNNSPRYAFGNDANEGIDMPSEQKFSYVLTRFAENTSCHAPPKILSHKSWFAKVFWLLCFLTGIGVFFYYFIDIMTVYLRYETTTGTELRFNVLEFPAVTFCNQNQFRADRLPDELKTLTDSFLDKRKQSLFGGEAAYEDFIRKELELETAIVKQLNSGSSDGPESDPSGPSATSASGPSATSVPAVGSVASATSATSAKGAGPVTSGPSAGSITTNGLINTATTVTDATASESATTANAAAGTTANAAADTTSNAAAGTTANAAAGGGKPGVPAGKRRRKRATASSVLTEDQMETIDSLHGFYMEPGLREIENMTWFNNQGSDSDDKELLLNFTSTIQARNSSELSLAGHSIEEMLQECSFLGKVCGPSDFRQFWDVNYGNCFTYNHAMDGEIAQIHSPGQAFGLSLTLFVNQNQYVGVLSPLAGVRMLLHRPGQVPLMEEDGFDLHPGTHNGIAVRYVEISRYKTIYSDCTTNKTVQADMELFYPGNYTQKGCIKTCLQLKAIENCGCANPLYRRPSNSTPCGPVDIEACVEPLENELLQNDYCKDKCPLPCWESQYQYMISNGQWPSNAYMPTLADSLKERGDDFRSIMGDSPRDGLSENFVKVTIYFDNLNFYKYTESLKISTSDLIGLMGGHLGLWIGMSIISFFELFEIIIHFFHICAQRLKRNKTGSLTHLKSHTPVQQLSDDKQPM